MLVKELIKAFLLLLCYVAANPALSRPGTLRYTLTDIVQVCGDGESILHAMQYSLIKRQRLLKESDVSGPETAAVRVVIARTVSREMVMLCVAQVSEAQRDLERKFRAWRSGASHMKETRKQHLTFFWLRTRTQHYTASRRAQSACLQVPLGTLRPLSGSYNWYIVHRVLTWTWRRV
jgi:hypothetical protein